MSLHLKSLTDPFRPESGADGTQWRGGVLRRLGHVRD